jgi:hypothetical protein
MQRLGNDRLPGTANCIDSEAGNDKDYLQVHLVHFAAGVVYAVCHPTDHDNRLADPFGVGLLPASRARVRCTVL